MKDPDAAQFRDLRYCGEAGKSVISGEVNGKNSYGAYGGFERFYFDAGLVEMQGSADTLFKRCLAQMDLYTRSIGGKPQHGGNKVAEIEANISLEPDNLSGIADTVHQAPLGTVPVVSLREIDEHDNDVAMEDPPIGDDDPDGNTFVLDHVP